MRKGKYKTPDDVGVEVLEFDADNKIAYVRFSDGLARWAAENEYSAWTSLEPSKAFEGVPEVEAIIEAVDSETETITIEIVEEPVELKDEDVAEVVEEKPKRKRTTKKKDK